MEQETSFAFVDMTIVKTENDSCQNFMISEYEAMVDAKLEILSTAQKLSDTDLNMNESTGKYRSVSISSEDNSLSLHDKSDSSKGTKFDAMKGLLDQGPLLIPGSSSLHDPVKKKLTVRNCVEVDQKSNVEEDINENDKKSFTELVPLAVISSGDLGIELGLPSIIEDQVEKIMETKKVLFSSPKESQVQDKSSMTLKNFESLDDDKENVITSGMQLKGNDEYLHPDNLKEPGADKSNVLTDGSKLHFDMSHRKRGRGRPRVLFKKTHPCSICHKVFSRKTHLTTHLRIHSDEKPYTCNLCGKRFRDNSVLIKHVRVHTQDKPYTCTVCGKAFNQKGNMERHARQHTNEKPFICSVCQNAFSNKSHLQRHFRIHVNEKPFTCELCDKAFRQKSHLMRHVLVHSREKPYTCNLCGKKFRQEQHVTRHKKTHIKEMITKVLLKNCITKSIHPRYLKFE